jgi:hypothetical protein
MKIEEIIEKYGQSVYDHMEDVLYTWRIDELIKQVLEDTPNQVMDDWASKIQTFFDLEQ